MKYFLKRSSKAPELFHRVLYFFKISQFDGINQHIIRELEFIESITLLQFFDGFLWNYHRNILPGTFKRSPCFYEEGVLKIVYQKLLNQHQPDRHNIGMDNLAVLHVPARGGVMNVFMS
jgi:hypothetical protein